MASGAEVRREWIGHPNLFPSSVGLSYTVPPPHSPQEPAGAPLSPQEPLFPLDNGRIDRRVRIARSPAVTRDPKPGQEG